MSGRVGPPSGFSFVPSENDKPGTSMMGKRTGGRAPGDRRDVANARGVRVKVSEPRRPESCVAHRKGRHEALTGEMRARSWNRETSNLRDADALATGGRQHLAQR